MKKIFFTIVLLWGMHAHSQNCMVVPEALKGTYEGDCKKDKADGKGTAAGQDSYTGDFKNGYPDGKGKYNWKSGDWYEGSWKKGQRDGQGNMHFIKEGGKDSTQNGFWKKDKYVGQYEYPYIIHNKSSYVTSADVVLNKANSATEIQFSIESMTSKISITNIDIISGQYMNKIDNDNLPKTFMSTLKNIQFPFRARITMGTEMLDIEFLEKASYTVDIKINK